MATKYFEPKATTVAQITTVTIGGTLSGETFTISVGGVTIASHTDTDTVIATAVAALVSAWNASGHAYATGITAVDSSPNIVFTGDTGGAIGGDTESGSPFILTLNTPGGSATFTQTETTSATSVHNIYDAANWSDGALPASNDTLIIADTDVNICWGLEKLTALTGLTVKVEQSYTGLIGLRSSQYAVNVAGDVYDSNAVEYRPTYLKLDIYTLEIGANTGTGSPLGSQRIKIDNTTSYASSIVKVFDTSETSIETNLPSVRLKLGNVNVLHLLSTSAGGVGIAIDVPGETSIVSDIYVDGTSSKLTTGSGVTVSNIYQYQGECTVDAAATVSYIYRYGGTLKIRDGVTVTNMIDSGPGYTTHNGISTNVSIGGGGTVDGTQSTVSRTWANVTLSDGTLKIDKNIVSITSFTQATKKMEITGVLL